MRISRNGAGITGVIPKDVESRVQGLRSGAYVLSFIHLHVQGLGRDCQVSKGSPYGLVIQSVWTSEGKGLKDSLGLVSVILYASPGTPCL